MKCLCKQWLAYSQELVGIQRVGDKGLRKMTFYRIRYVLCMTGSKAAGQTKHEYSSVRELVVLYLSALHVLSISGLMVKYTYGARK